MRNLVECEFSKKVLDSMCFASFVQSRGAPFRICDIFDEVGEIGCVSKFYIQNRHNVMVSNWNRG